MIGTTMYGKIQELRSLGYKKQRAARELEIDTKTVRKYWEMTEEEYILARLESKERVSRCEKYESNSRIS